MLILMAPIVLVAVGFLSLFFAAPWLVDFALDRYVAASPERAARVEDVRFNPFTLKMELAAAELRDGGVELRAGRISLDMSYASFVERRPVFTAVTIEQPRLHIEWTGPSPPPSEALALLRLDHLELSDGVVELVDQNAGGRSFTLRGIRLMAAQLDASSTVRAEPAADGHFTLSGIGADGAELEVDGTLTSGFASANGQVALSGLDLAASRPWLSERLGALALTGLFDLAGEYQLSAPFQAPVLEIMDARAELHELDFEPATGTRISAPSVSGTLRATLTLAAGLAAAHGRLDLTHGGFELRDTRMSPPAAFALGDLSGSLTAEPDEAVWTIDLEGTLADAGSASLSARLPAARDAERTFGLKALDVPARMLSPYATESLGHALDSGQVDLDIGYVERDARIAGDLRLITRGLAFAAAETEGVRASDEPSLELAVALLEDARGVIELAVPLATSPGTRGIGGVIKEALQARIATLSAAPFVELGALAARDAETLRAVPFVPGDAGLTAAALDTIAGLGDALSQRPRLGLRVTGGFDAAIDRDALAKQQIELHVLLATAGPSPQARAQPVDFASPRAQDVLDEFAAERLAAAQVEALATRFDCSGALNALCRRAYYAAVFDALVANEAIETATLTRLGRFRAQSVANSLSELGIAAERIEVTSGAATGSGRGIGLPLELTVTSGSQVSQ